jgi:predicted MFS family arabinose efflux permease
MAAGVAFCAAATGVPLLIAGQAIAGFGGALAAPAMWAYLAEHAAPDRHGRATGLGITCYALGQVLGVPAAPATTQFTSWRWAYAALGACLLAALPVVVTRLTGTRPAGDGEPRALLRAWRLANARRALLATGAMQAGRLGAYTYVGVLYTQRFHFTPGRLAAMGLVVGAGTLAGSLAAGVLNDHWRARGHTEPALSGAWALLFALAAPVALTADRLEISLVALFVWFVAGAPSTRPSRPTSARPIRITEPR